MRPADMTPAERLKHGTRGRYVTGCRCDECRAANAAYARRRDARGREIALSHPSGARHGEACPGVEGVPCQSGVRIRANSVAGICYVCRDRLPWNGTVDVGRARRHLRKLAARGVGRRAVSAACDVALSVLMQVGQGKKKRIRKDTERRILSVDVGARSDASLVPAGPTWRLVRRLLARGFTKGEIAVRLGHKRKALQLGRTRVLARTAAAVERLCRTAEPPEPREERIGLAPSDLVPCARCGLRGHVAGDVERCLRGAAAAGLGSSAWMGGGV